MINEKVHSQREVSVETGAEFCFGCEKQFDGSRSKHRCLHCNLAYCLECSTAKTSSSEDGTLEICCHSCEKETEEAASIAEYIKRLVKSPVPSKSEESESISTISEFIERKGLKKLSTPGQSKVLLKTLEHQPTDDPSEALKTHLFEKIQSLGYSSEMVQSIFDMVQYAASNVICSVHGRDDKMNPNEYINIIRVPGPELSILEFMNGVAISHNEESKFDVENPRILLLQGSVDREENTSFLINLIIGIVSELNANVIIIEESIPQEAIAELEKMKVLVISHVKYKKLEVIAKSVQGQILLPQNKISAGSKYLGTCKRIRWNRYYILENSPDVKTVGSIILSGPDSQEMKTLSYYIRYLIKYFRNMLIESKFGEQLLINPGFVDMYEQFFAKRLMIYQDIVCMKNEVIGGEYYSSADLTILQFLTNLLNESDEVCHSKVNHYKVNHINYFFSLNGRVKICVQTASNCGESEFFTIKHECRVCQRESNPPSFLSAISCEYSFFKFLSVFFSQNTWTQLQCKHNPFHHGCFIFQIEKTKVVMEYEENVLFDLVETESIAAPDHSKIKIILFEKMKTSGLEVFQNMEEQCLNLFKSLEEYEKEPENQSWNMIKVKTFQLNNSISKKISDLRNLLPGTFESQLEIETYRRFLLIQANEMRLYLEDIVELMRKLVKKGRLSKDVLNSTGINYKIRNNVNLTINESSAFQYLQGGSLTLPLGRYGMCIPVNENDNMSIIAYTLNSKKYSSFIKSFSSHEEAIRSDLKEPFYLKLKTYKDKDIRRLGPLPQLKKLFGPSIEFRVKVYYPNQFHYIRDYIYGKDFINSVFRANEKVIQLARKGTFQFSHDGKFIIKVSERRELNTFRDLAPGYFEYVCSNIFNFMPSLMVKILGLFKISVKKEQAWVSNNEIVILCENLGFYVPKPLHTYDLKGTINPRRKVSDGDPRTRMDLNFIEDFNGVPLTLPENVMKKIEYAVWNDTLFFSQNNIIDYSLLVILNFEKKLVSIGIIDYFEKYTFEKAIESKYKKYIVGLNPTIIQTHGYKDRFRMQIIDSYFLSI